MLLAILCTFPLTGCNGINKYNAVMYSHAQNWLTKEFQREHRVSSYVEWPPNFQYEEFDPDEYYCYDKSLDDERTIIIPTQEEFDKAFKQCGYTVCFEKELVILYFFGDCSPRDYYLKKVTLKDKTLNIEFKLKEIPRVYDTIQLYQRCFMVKMNKVEFDTVNFIEQR